MVVEKILLADQRGFCAGVERAIKVVEDALDIFGKPVYVKHQIVHNKHVVHALEEKGAITVEDLEKVPDHGVVVFSAHGSPPEHFDLAKKKQLRIIDATCPLVTKVHLEAHRYAREGYQIIYIGHKGHMEAIGVLGELPSKISLVENVQDVEALDLIPSESMIYLTQTTLSVDETREIIAALKMKYPFIKAPASEDICYATTNRQEAIKAIAKQSDLVLVVGSKNSSNSQRLVETVKAQGVPAFLIDDIHGLSNIPFEGVKTLGLSSGASAPESLVQDIIHYFKNAVVEQVKVTEEKMFFVDPPEIVKYRKIAKQY